MKFKSYSGRNLAEIVPRIREELGPEAVILKQRSTRSGGVGGFFARTVVEVLAADAAPSAATGEAQVAQPDYPTAATAVAERPAPRVDTSDGESQEELLRATFAAALSSHVEATRGERPASAETTREPELAAAPMASARQAARAAYGSAAVDFEPVRIAAERRDRGGLRLAAHAVDEPRGADRLDAPWPAAPDEESADLALELERSGIAPALAAALVREVRFHVEPFTDGSFRELARRRIAARIRVEQGWVADGTARRIAVVGPSGAGKTTAIANLAAGFGAGGMSVGIVVVERRADHEHAVLPRLGATGGSEADRALAYMAGADIIRLASAAEMTRAVSRLKGRDVMLIDTPGLVADERSTGLVRATLAAAAPHEVHAVLPLGLADREAAATLAQLDRLGANRLLVTKTDEARFAGPLFALATGFDLPLGYLACSPSVPGGLVPADGGSIAERILPI